MITSTRNGFFTASMIVLMITFAVIAGSLRLVSGLNHLSSSISVYDRMYIKGVKQLKGIELKLKGDARFPDYDAFISYVLKNQHIMYQNDEVILSYLTTITLPDGSERHRFNMTETINGRAFVKPVSVLELTEGEFKVHLEGIAH